MFVDSNDSVLEASESSKRAVEAFFSEGDAEALSRLAFSKPDRGECLAILSLIGEKVRQ